MNYYHALPDGVQEGYCDCGRYVRKVLAPNLFGPQTTVLTVDSDGNEYCE